MKLFIEAWANASSSGSVYAIIKELIGAMGGATEKELSSLVEQSRIYADAAQKAQASGVAWDKGLITSALGSLDHAPVGVGSVSAADAQSLGAPVDSRGTVQTLEAGGHKLQTYFVAQNSQIQVWSRIHAGAWSPWMKQVLPGDVDYLRENLWKRGGLNKSIDDAPIGVSVITTNTASQAAGAPLQGYSIVVTYEMGGAKLQSITGLENGYRILWRRFTNGKWGV
ncbi:hypothetical protein WM41_2510, partial [Corynebacterium simulans]